MAMEQTSEISETAEIPSGTVTFLFTDIEGSTRLLEQLREQYAALLEEQRDLLRLAFSHWNGHEIDTQGDAFFVAFGKAIEAVNCVMEAQHLLAEHAWPQGVRLRVRMGLHTGEPIVARTGYVGMDVHRAARIASAGYGGQVLVSQTTRELIFQDLPQGATLRDLGEHKLKDIRFPQHIYQLVIDGLASDFPPLKTLSAAEEPPTPGEAPYKGLQYFDEPDAAWFFGREQVTARLVEAVQDQRFLAVIGASGSGKSSVVRAGLAPSLKRSQPGRWQAFVFTPTAHPLESLAVSLTRQTASLSATAELMDAMLLDRRSLHLFVQRSLNLPDQTKLLLVVDQFEELFTQCRALAERQAFIDNLLVGAENEAGSTHVLLALRADFYEHVAQYPELRELVSSQQIYIGAMDAAELRQAIEEPAKRGGWELSPGLADLILHDIGASESHQPEPGALPLLSHALLETWKRRRGNLMNLRAYTEAGGVRRAIAHTADRVYSQELTPAQQDIARGIFLRLTELGEGAQDTRRRISIHELIPPGPAGETEQIRAVLVKLADARLITTGEGTVEVAHEALIREWPTLREWLSQDREGLRLHRRLTEAAQEWELLERDSGALYRGAHLAQALEWALNNPIQLNAQEQAFIGASKEAAEGEETEREAQRQRELHAAQKLAEAERQRAGEQSRAARRLRHRALFLTFALLLAGILAVAAIILARQAGNNAQIAQANAQNAQSARAQAEFKSAQAIAMQATAENESMLRATQEAIAGNHTRLAGSRELAAAALSNLQVDPERSILLSLEALKKADTLEAENSLHQALLAFRLTATIQVDSKSVFGVAVNPDGSKFASAGMDGWVKVWRMGDPAAVQGETPLLSLPNPVDFDVSFETTGYTLAFSPDGSRLASIGEKQSAKIWDAANGRLLQTLTASTGNVFSLAFSPDGKRVVTSTAGGSATIWDVVTGQELLTVNVPDYYMIVAVFTPDGKRLVTGGDDGIARFWDLEITPGKELFSITFDYQIGPPDAFAFSPDGKYLAVGTGTIGKVWKLEELQANPAARPLFILFGHQNNINSLAFTPDGSRLVTGSADSTAKIWDASTGQELFTLAGGMGNINSMAISPDGIHPLTAHSDGKVKIWDISPTGSHEWWTVDKVWRGRLSPDGKSLATIYTSELSGEVEFKLWNLSPSGARQVHGITVDQGARVSIPTINSDLSRYATTGANSILKVWDPITGQLLQSFPISGTTQSSGHTNIVFGLDFSPDSSRIATGGDDGKAIVWEVASGKALLTLTGHQEPVRGIAFSPDGSLLATASFDGTARIWEATTGQLLQTLSGHEGLVIYVHFSPDGKRVLTSGKDNTARVWDVQTGKELLILRGHTSTVFGLDFSPDGTRIATGSADGTVKVWDASTGQTLLTLPGFYVEFTPDGKSLVTYAVSDGIGRGFYLDIQKLTALARSRLTRSLTLEECQTYLHTQTCPPTP